MKQAQRWVAAVLLGIGFGGSIQAAAPAAAPDIEILREKASQGDAEAQHSLGRMYLTGKGVPQDYQIAVELFRKGAEQGYAPLRLALRG